MIRLGARRRRSGARCWLEGACPPCRRDSSQSCRRGFSALGPASPDPTNEAGGSSGMVAGVVDYVLGADTHLDEHVQAVVASPGGAVLAQRAVAANRRGYAQALR